MPADFSAVSLEGRVETDANGASRSVTYTSGNMRVSCHQRDCAVELHSFYASDAEPTIPAGLCQGCGKDFIDWDLHHRRNPGDLELTVDALKQEWIRHLYWTCAISPEVQRLVHMRGRERLLGMFRTKMTTHLANPEPFRDGYAVPYDGDPINFIRHATASCCRRCANYWHGIEMGVEMSGEQVDYLVALARSFILERFPDSMDAPDPTYRKGGINSNDRRVAPRPPRKRRGRVFEP